MSDDKKKESIWVFCLSCGQKKRNHFVLSEKVERHYEDEDGGGPHWDKYHRMVQCKGCESIKYVTSTQDFYGYESEEENFKVYPDELGFSRGRQVTINKEDALDENERSLIPEAVWKMYKETIDALNANAKTLAAGGLRATVEAICINSGLKKGDLNQKITELVNQSLLTASQAELLHEERYLGNAALHELETPSPNDIEDGLGIVEGLINTLYILPSKAKRLRDRRKGKTDNREP